MSAYLAVSATAGALLLGVPAALVISRVDFPGSRAVAAFFLSPLVLPVIVIGVAILQLASNLGFARTFWAMLAGHIVIVIPYIVRTTLASLTGMAPGASRRRRRISAPVRFRVLPGDAAADQARDRRGQPCSP